MIMGQAIKSFLPQEIYEKIKPLADIYYEFRLHSNFKSQRQAPNNLHQRPGNFVNTQGNDCTPGP